MDGDEESLGVKAMHLNKTVVVRGGSIRDEEDEIVVVVELGTLAKMLRVLDGERMKAEDVAQDLEVAATGSVEVEPEELPSREQGLDGVAAEMHLVIAGVVHDVANRRTVRRSAQRPAFPENCARWMTRR